MKIRSVVWSLTLVTATAAITSQVISQDSTTKPFSAKQAQKEAAQPFSAKQAQEEQMAKWIQYSTPSEHHKQLEPFVGKWNTTIKWWMYPGATAQESIGTAEFKWILDGRFLVQKNHGEWEGEKFEGFGIFGYDNFREEFNSFWIDNMTTAFMTSKGNTADNGKAIKLQGKMDNLMTGEKNQNFRTVNKIIDVNTHVFEMHMKSPQGEQFKTLEVTYTRAQ